MTRTEQKPPSMYQICECSMRCRIMQYALDKFNLYVQIISMDYIYGISRNFNIAYLRNLIFEEWIDISMENETMQFAGSAQARGAGPGAAPPVPEALLGEASKLHYYLYYYYIVVTIIMIIIIIIISSSSSSRRSPPHAPTTWR